VEIFLSKFDPTRICINGSETNQNQPYQHRKEAQLLVGTTGQENHAFGRMYACNNPCNNRGDENDFFPRSTLTGLAVTGTRGYGCTGPVIRAGHRCVDYGCAAASACLRTTRLSG
jgi:hypothetical protein